MGDVLEYPVTVLDLVCIVVEFFDIDGRLYLLHGFVLQVPELGLFGLNNAFICQAVILSYFQGIVHFSVVGIQQAKIFVIQVLEALCLQYQVFQLIIYFFEIGIFPQQRFIIDLFSLGILCLQLVKEIRHLFLFKLKEEVVQRLAYGFIAPLRRLELQCGGCEQQVIVQVVL